VRSVASRCPKSPRAHAVAVALLHCLVGHLSRLAYLSVSFRGCPTGGSDAHLRPRRPSAEHPPDAFVHPDAVVIGDVRIGSESSVWPGAVFARDYGTIIIGARTSIQDGTVVHAVEAFPTVVGDDCVIGHIVHLEGCVIHDRALVGSGSVVLHHAHRAFPARPSPQERSCAIVWTFLKARWRWGFRPRLEKVRVLLRRLNEGAALYVWNVNRYKTDLRLL